MNNVKYIQNITLSVLLAVVIVLLMISVHQDAKAGAYTEIEKKCLYGERLEFSGKLFSCYWMEGVTENNTPYERKSHPLAKELK